jgi:N-acetyltransferase
MVAVTQHNENMTRPAITGQWVALEPLSNDHVAPLAAAAAEDRSTYGLTFIADGPVEMADYVARALADERAGVAEPYAVRRLADDRIVGSTRFMDIDDFDAGSHAARARGDAASRRGPVCALEIGSTWYAASAQRSAVNTECKLLLLSRAFDEWHVLRVTFKTDARNERSRTAIARIGGQFEGVRRAHMYGSDGAIRDTAYFSIVAAEWPHVRQGLLARLGPPTSGVVTR